MTCTRSAKIRYASPLVQIVVVGLICFCCPGMFNALNGMGAGGKIADTTASAANVALYTCFALFGLVAGTVHNALGPRLSMLLGGATFVLYVGAFLVYNHTEAPAFTVVAGALLGVGAALLWTAQGALMMSYPTEASKGRFIAVFWAIFNLGGVLGGFIPFALNFHGQHPDGVNDATYIAFMAVMSVGALLSLALLPPEQVVREDGTPVKPGTDSDSDNGHASSSHAVGVVASIGAVLGLFRDPTMLLLAPMFLASNWFYSYQFNGVNAPLFNIRTRGLNNVFYWGSQMLGAWMMGRFLDTTRWRRSQRGQLALAFLVLTFSAVWGGGLALQLTYRRDDPGRNLDFLDAASASGPMTLYFCYGLLDAMLQTWCYWVMGATTNDASRLSLYAGFYKAVQSAGGAASWAIDAAMTEYVAQLVVNWAIVVVAAPFAWVVTRRLADTSQPDADKDTATGQEKQTHTSFDTRSHN